MKTLKFNSKSWHYWLATKIGDFDVHEGDFCAYVRSVIFSILFSLLLAAMAVFLLYSSVMEFYAAYTCWFTPVCTFGKFERGFATVVLIIACITAVAFLFVWRENRKFQIRMEINSGIRPPQQPGFVKTAYKSLKEKTCFKVEFE